MLYLEKLVKVSPRFEKIMILQDVGEVNLGLAD